MGEFGMCMRLGIVSTLVFLDKTVCILHLLACDSSLNQIELRGVFPTI